MEPINGALEKQKIIEKNLETLEMNTQLKKVAQARYYAKLLEAPTGINKMIKRPVHTRLGGRMKFRFRTPNNVDGLILKTKRFALRRNNQKQMPNNYKRIRILRSNPQSAQIRLQRIRQNNIPQYAFNQNNINIHQPQRIRLRRKQHTPMNYMIQVKNENATQPTIKHSIRAALNQQLQLDIRALQDQSERVPEIIDPGCVHVTGYGLTRINLNDRFSSYD